MKALKSVMSANFHSRKVFMNWLQNHVHKNYDNFEESEELLPSPNDAHYFVQTHVHASLYEVL